MSRLKTGLIAAGLLLVYTQTATRAGVTWTSQNRYVQNGQHWAEDAGIGPITDHNNAPISAPDFDPWTIGSLNTPGFGFANYYQNSTINPTSIVASGRVVEASGDGGNVLQSGWAISVCEVTFTVDSDTPYSMVVACRGINGPSDYCYPGTVTLTNPLNQVQSYAFPPLPQPGSFSYTGTLTPGVWKFNATALGDHHAGPLDAWPPNAFIATFTVPEPAGLSLALLSLGVMTLMPRHCRSSHRRQSHF